MTYQPYLIANFATALDKRLQPWLSPDDAQLQLYDGFVYRGVQSKREGYNYFATGDRSGAPYRESRIIHTLTAVPMVGTIDGVNRTFTLAGTAQIARGSVVVTGSNPAQVLTDNGLGGFTGAGTGTINYTTGAISVTFTLPPLALSTVLVTYSFMPGNPVMMVANFITATNIKQLIVADTRYVNRYNPNTNILEDISPATPYTGTYFDFFTWTNYASATNTPRLLFSNNVDPIQQYDGSTVIDYVYTLSGITTLTCATMVQMKDRLILLRTTENGTIFPQRIRISGTGANADVFDSTATGAGFIDIPDGTWIQGAAFNRDDLIIFTEASTWVLKYTGNDTTPFVLNLIDESRGSQAAFSAITYLNRTSAASPRGLIISDGYRVERQDESIPDFSFDEVSGANFSLCFAGTVDADRDHYLIYPPEGESESKRILTTNYDEDNYSIYRLSLSCMGTYVTAFDITWNDLLAYPTWEAFSAAYGNWNSFAYTAGAPFSIGGGHHGEIWRLAVTGLEDNPVRIYNISQPASNLLEITTDWNNFHTHPSDQEMGTDTIFFTGISGMVELNNQQCIFDSWISNNVFRVQVNPAQTFSAYTSGGECSRVIPFSSLFKQFNPFIDTDKKVRCGWLYMYVDSAGTNLTRNLPVVGATNANPAVITTSIPHGLQNGNLVSFFSIGGMTELNSLLANVTVITNTSFSLNGIDSTGFGVFTSGGYATVAEPAKMDIQIFTNDRGPGQYSKLNDDIAIPYQGSITNLQFEDGQKKWYKVFINQTGRFIQFKFLNKQAGATINIQAVMPGFQPVGRII
jgi:Ubiquitin-activating enzyme E1 FCCH domain